MSKCVGKLQLEVTTDIEEVNVVIKDLVSQRDDLLNALEEILDGKSCYDLSEETGYSEMHCEDWFKLIESIKEKESK